jgi:tRNA A37 threonylcarbamoyladenosine biosynthesis protein TsaE
LGLAKPIKDMGFQLEFNSLAHLVQKLTSYEQHHPDIYQDKFKRQITLVDTEDVEDSGEKQEVAIAEWTQGGKSSVLQMVKQQGPTKGFDFDESKVEQIFDLLLREK